MENFVLFAQPWWVNLLILVPVISYFAFRRGLAISKTQLAVAGVFGAAFGMVEAAVVIYLRAALGILPGFQMVNLIGTLPGALLNVELLREAATIVILVCAAILTVRHTRERWAVFLWMFAFWDIFFYYFLWLIIRWPYSLVTTDILFLIPAPWIAQVWFPLLVSSSAASVIAFSPRVNG